MNKSSNHRISKSLNQSISFFRKYNPGLKGFSLFKCQRAIGDDDDHVSNSAFTGGRAIETANTGAPFAFDDIGIKSLTVVMERAVDVVCLMAVFVAALFFQGHIIGDFVASLFGGFFKNKSGETSASKIILSTGGFLAFIAIVYLLLKRFGHIDAVGKIKNILKGILNGLQSIRYIKHKGWFVFHSLLIWVLYLLSTTIGIYALRETAHLGFGGGLTTLAVGSVGMVITPGGIGAYPLLVSRLIGLYGIDETTIGNALGWLLWTVQTLIILIGGVVLIALFSYYNKNKRSSEARARLTDEDIAPI